jgi:hypothetical protein
MELLAQFDKLKNKHQVVVARMPKKPICPVFSFFIETAGLTRLS